MTALIRNLGVMGSVGLLVPGAWDVINQISETLTNDTLLHKSRVHPMTMITAYYTYRNGRGTKGHNTWEVVPQIEDALEEGFYKSFANVEPTGKRFMLAIDTSGSMSWNDLQGIPGFTPCVASAVMAMVTARSEKNYTIHAFSDTFVNLPITAKSTLDQVLQITGNMRHGSTNCSLPMVHALKNGMAVDQFCIYTDSEVNTGNIHPAQALKKYRELTGINAKLAVVAMESNAFSIADPNDPGMMDFVGFDANTPQAISTFAQIAS
jgi:60 kDa SS-A/Ro ribonucleoprotein